MFKSDFVVSVKGPKGYFKESNGSVELPFDTEYSIYLKNMKPQQDAVATVKIDGQAVINDLVVRAGSSVTLERFVEGFSMSEGPRFKFIKRIREIEEHRGIKAEDGLLTVEWSFAKYKEPYAIYDIGRRWGTIPKGGSWGGGSATNEFFPQGPSSFSTTTRSLNMASSDVIGLSADTLYSCAASTDNCSVQAQDVGITTEGTSSSQSFTYVSDIDLEHQKHTMTLSLTPAGIEEDTPEEVLYTRRQIDCKMCGRKVSTSDNFCGTCGTAVR